jgi:hypothetical protein
MSRKNNSTSKRHSGWKEVVNPKFEKHHARVEREKDLWENKPDQWLKERLQRTDQVNASLDAQHDRDSRRRVTFHERNKRTPRSARGRDRGKLKHMLNQDTVVEHRPRSAPDPRFNNYNKQSIVGMDAFCQMMDRHAFYPFRDSFPITPKDGRMIRGLELAGRTIKRKISAFLPIDSTEDRFDGLKSKITLGALPKVSLLVIMFVARWVMAMRVQCDKKRPELWYVSRVSGLSCLISHLAVARCYDRLGIKEALMYCCFEQHFAIEWNKMSEQLTVIHDHMVNHIYHQAELKLETLDKAMATVIARAAVAAQTSLWGDRDMPFSSTYDEVYAGVLDHVQSSDRSRKAKEWRKKNFFVDLPERFNSDTFEFLKLVFGCKETTPILGMNDLVSLSAKLELTGVGGMNYYQVFRVSSVPQLVECYKQIAVPAPVVTVVQEAATVAPVRKRWGDEAEEDNSKVALKHLEDIAVNCTDRDALAAAMIAYHQSRQ